MKNPRGRPRSINKHVHPLVRVLHEARLKRKITQGELGKIVGYGANAIARWESGTHSPTLKSLQDWCQSLGMILKMEEK